MRAIAFFDDRAYSLRIADRSCGDRALAEGTSCLSAKDPLQASALWTIRQGFTVAKALQNTGPESETEASSNSNDHYYFALLYAIANSEWHRFAAATEFRDFFYLLSERFYQLYYDSVVRRTRKESDFRRSACWDAYFDAARDFTASRSLRRFNRMLRCGVYAHIVGDLHEAIASTLAWQGRTDRAPVDLDALRNEFLSPRSSRTIRRITDRFLRVMSNEIRHPGPPRFRRLLFGIGKEFSGCGVRKVQGWRSLAWTKAQDASAAL